MGYLQGFLVTLRQIKKLGGTHVTTEYSGGYERGRHDEKIAQARAPPRPPRPQPVRGRHGEVHRVRAVRRRVPGPCIYVRGADNPPDDPVSPGERYGYVYEINYLRCIHCDLCVEACPTEAITETKLFEFSFTNRRDAIYTKAELLVDDDGKPQQLPWEDWREGDDAAHVGLDAGHRAVAATPTSRARWRGRASSATACARPRPASRGATPRRRPDPC